MNRQERNRQSLEAILSDNKFIKSEYDEEILISVGEFGQGGDITVRKEDGKWYSSDGKTFMGYLTPEEIVEWYDKDYGSAWLCNSRKPIKSSTGTIHCVYLSDITPTEWTKDMALAAIKNSVTNYGYYEYNGKKGLCIVGDFDDIHSFIESNGRVVDEDYIYHWKEFPWDNAKKLDTVKSSRRPIKSGYNDLFNQIKKYIEDETVGKGRVETEGNIIHYRTLIVTVDDYGYSMHDTWSDFYDKGDNIEDFKEDYWEWVNPF